MWCSMKCRQKCNIDETDQWHILNDNNEYVKLNSIVHHDQENVQGQEQSHEQLREQVQEQGESSMSNGDTYSGGETKRTMDETP